MSYRLRLNHRNSAVILTFAGEVTAKELWQSRTDATAALAAKQWKRVLVDFGRSVPRFRTEEVFEFTAGHADVFPRGTRLAVVVPDGKLVDFADFAVTVARNRGFQMSGFREIRLANRWLIG